MTRILRCALLIALLAPLTAVTAAPTFNYQGRVAAHGTNFTGTGYFKFVLLDGSDNGLWSNDGTGGGGEPGWSVAVEVNNGLFNVELGQGMQEIPPLTLHQGGLKLRTWFSSNGVTFEQLAPDVAMRPPSFADIDTGHNIVVDSEGKGDFDNLQDAINYMASNTGYQVILVMPGYYPLSAPLVFPTNPAGDYVDYSIRGLGDRWRVFIENTGGPAAYPQRCRLENLCLRGDPAIADAGSDPNYWFQARRCGFQRFATPGPTVELGSPGGAELFECDLSNDSGSDALRLSGDAGVDAKHCDFYVWSADGDALALAGQRAGANFESCRFSGSQDTGVSLSINNSSNATANFKGCNFDHGVTVTSGLTSQNAYGATFSSCEIGGGLTVSAGDPHLEFDECRIEGWMPDVMAVDIVGLQPGANIWFRNCNIFAQGATAFRIWDAIGEVRVKDCEVHANNGYAVEVVRDESLTGEWGVDNVRFYRSRIMNYGDSPVFDAVRVRNDPDGEAWQARVEIEDCAVSSDLRDGIACDGGEVTLRGATVDGRRYSVLSSNGFFSASLGTLNGGVLLAGGGFADFARCRIDGHEGDRALSLIDRGYAGLSDCEIHSASNTALYVQDTGLDATACKISASGGMAVEATVSAANNAQMTFRQAAIRGDLSYGLTNLDAVAVVNDPANETWQASVRLVDSQVYGQRDGLRVQQGELDLWQSSVEAGRHGIFSTNSEIGVEAASYVQGLRHGIYAVGSSSVGIRHSSVEGGDEDTLQNGDGLHMEANGTDELFFISDSNVSSYGDDPTQCRAVYAAWTNASGIAGILKSTLDSNGTGLELAGGTYVIENSMFHSDARQAVVLKYTNTVASFSGCNFYGMTGGNTNAALLLYGTLASRPTPPKIWNCAFGPLMEPGTAKYSIGIGGTATSAAVRLVNSILCTNLDPRVTIVTARTNLINGNIIP
jgi:hypothetical protein